MNTYFLLQVFSSFLIGGFLITLLSLLAERSSERISGIIMMFPSTIVLGFFFLGWSTSAAQISQIAPATLIPLGIVILSSVFYTYVALVISKCIYSKFWQIIVTIVISIVIWFILAAPFALRKFNNLYVGITGYFMLVMLAHFIMKRHEYKEVLIRPRYTKYQIFLRGIFMGTIIASVVIMGKILNPFWGGIFAMFPAATFAALITFHFYYVPEKLFYFMKKAPLGSVSLFTYVICSMLFFSRYGLILGTAFSYLICLGVSLLLVKISKYFD